MTSYVTVIGGVKNGNTLSGIVSVPSSLATVGGTNNGASFLGMVQNYLDSVSASVVAGNTSLINYDSVKGANDTYSFTVPASQGGVYEVTNTDSVGGTVTGSASGSVTVPTGYNTVVIEAPGTVSVTGNSTLASTYVLGSQTNTMLSTAGSGSGGNTIYELGNAGAGNTVYASSGNNTIWAAGNNNLATLGGTGLDRYKVLGGSNTVVATGNATVQAGIPNGFTGSLDFINESTAQATVFGEQGAVTAYGGAAGGLYYGGTTGNNSLVGGAGMATLVGSTSGDVLKAGFQQDGTTAIPSALNNYLFAGSGNETLIASAGTQNNLIDLGAGAGASDTVSTAGSGYQFFFNSTVSGGGTATITGSTATNAENYYFLGTTVNSSSGITDYIENYSSLNSHLYAYNGDVISSIGSTTGSYAQQGALVTLSDGTQVVLVGVDPSKLSGTNTVQLNYN